MSDDLPHSPKAEQALLGILLYDNLAAERIPPSFKAEHMHDPVHARLCGAVMEAIFGGGSANPIMLLERFGEDEAFKQIGGFGYLADLVDHAPPGVEVFDLCLMLTDLAVRREMIRLGEKVIHDARSDRETPALAQVDNLERDLFQLATSREETGPQSLDNVFGGALEMAAAAYARDDGMAGRASGLVDLDQKLGGFRPGNLIIIAARPSMGKSSLALNIAFHNAKTHQTEEQPDGSVKLIKGGVSAFDSLEMSSDELGLRLLAEETGISSERITAGKIDATEFGRLRDAALELRDKPLYIDATGGISLAAIATRARRLKRTVGLDILIIDYLQLITIGSDKHMSPQERVSAATQGLKALAKELDIPIIALSQLTRKVEEREDKKPQLADLRESGAIEQDADAVLFVYRAIYYLEKAPPKEGSLEHMKWEEECDRVRNEAEIIIGKQRHGSTGIVRVAFNSSITKFYDAPRDGDPHSA